MNVCIKMSDNMEKKNNRVEVAGIGCGLQNSSQT